MTRIGILGYGEVGSTLGEALCQGGATVRAYDTAGAPAAIFAPLGALLAGSDIVLSTVTTEAALAAARDALPYLRPEQVYCDLNSTAPRIKVAIDELLQPSGVRFVEGAILGAIGVSGARTRILLGGDHSDALSKDLKALGLNTAFYSPQIGEASMFKMLRSIFSKGLEALIIEFLMAGQKAGLAEDLWREVTELFSKNSFEEVARSWVLTHAKAHERRYHEMLQVREVLRELPLEAVMTEATTRFFARSCELQLAEGFTDRPGDMSEVTAELLRRQRETAR